MKVVLHALLLIWLSIWLSTYPDSSHAESSANWMSGEQLRTNTYLSQTSWQTGTKSISDPADADLCPPPSPKPLPDDLKKGRDFLTDFEFGLTLVILLFGALVLLVEYLLLRHAKKSSYELMQLFAVNLIITGTLVLISAGYDATQIAPAFGLFGTIAGYLLGRQTRRDDSDNDKVGER